MNQRLPSPHQITAATGGWAWPRLLRHLGIGPSSAGMLALPYLRQLPTSTPPPEQPADRS
jgi:hypothetical protein